MSINTPISRQSMLRVCAPQSGLRARSAQLSKVRRTRLSKNVFERSELFLRPLEASTADAYREAGRSSGRTDTQRDLAQVQTNERKG
jgi:hypothetical protein